MKISNKNMDIRKGRLGNDYIFVIIFTWLN